MSTPEVPKLDLNVPVQQPAAFTNAGDAGLHQPGIIDTSSMSGPQLPPTPSVAEAAKAFEGAPAPAATSRVGDLTSGVANAASVEGDLAKATLPKAAPPPKATPAAGAVPPVGGANGPGMFSKMATGIANSVRSSNPEKMVNGVGKISIGRVTGVSAGVLLGGKGLYDAAKLVGLKSTGVDETGAEKPKPGFFKVAAEVIGGTAIVLASAKMGRGGAAVG